GGIDRDVGDLDYELPVPGIGNGLLDQLEVRFLDLPDRVGGKAELAAACHRVAHPSTSPLRATSRLEAAAEIPVRRAKRLANRSELKRDRLERHHQVRIGWRFGAAEQLEDRNRLLA